MQASKKSLPVTGVALGICYTLYIFVLIYAEMNFNYLSGVYVSGSKVTALYCAASFFIACGYLLFAVLQRKAACKDHRLLSFVIPCGLFFAGISGFYIDGLTLRAFAALRCAASLGLGYAGGGIHLLLAEKVSQSKYCGKLIGVSVFLSTLLQMLIQKTAAASSAAAGIVSAAAFFSVCLIIAILSSAPVPKTFEKEEYKPRSVGKNIRRALLTAGAAGAVMAVIVAVNDGIVTSLYNDAMLPLYAYPRLIYAGAALIAGFAADMAGGRYLSIFTACAMLISTLGTVFLIAPATYMFSLAVFYFYAGFYIIFITLSFVRLAGSTSFPALFAGAGRIIHSLVCAAVADAAAVVFAASPYAPIVFTCILTVAVALICLTDKREAAAGAQPEPHSCDAGQFSKKYLLTEREREVLLKLTEEDGDMKQIAAELFISERVLYRHAANIYRKTNTVSRASLTRLYLHEENDVIK